MGIDTKILFLSILQSYVEMNEMEHFFPKKILKKIGNHIQEHLFTFYDCKSISVARSEVRNIHTHIPVNKGITIQTVSVYGGE